MLNDRSFKLITKNVTRSTNYVALARAARVYERPLTSAARYFMGFGGYPCSVRVRTPLGSQSLNLFGSHDAVTVHEIFCREDYRCPSPPQVVIDLGSNIGVSALYFLTRSPSTYCELYEPDPRNLPKLLQNIQGYSERCVVHQRAVADTEGTLPFVREPTGRYGTLGAGSLNPGSQHGGGRDEISVRVEHINTVLEQAVARYKIVDLLKIDTEGFELATLRAIDLTLLRYIRHIAIEWPNRNVKLDGFHVSSSCDVIKFRNKSLMG
jgi:FkbM family methyltransferase